MKNTDMKITNLIDDEMLEGVTGGAGKPVYTDKQFKDAGVSVININGKNIYSVMINGKLQTITPDVANSLYDCYKVGGYRKPSDQMIKDLIEQDQI